MTEETTYSPLTKFSNREFNHSNDLILTIINFVLISLLIALVHLKLNPKKRKFDVYFTLFLYTKIIYEFFRFLNCINFFKKFKFVYPESNLPLFEELYMLIIDNITYFLLWKTLLEGTYKFLKNQKKKSNCTMLTDWSTAIFIIFYILQIFIFYIIGFDPTIYFLAANKIIRIILLASSLIPFIVILLVTLYIIALDPTVDSYLNRITRSGLLTYMLFSGFSIFLTFIELIASILYLKEGIYNPINISESYEIFIFDAKTTIFVISYLIYLGPELFSNFNYFEYFNINNDYSYLNPDKDEPLLTQTNLKA